MGEIPSESLKLGQLGDRASWVETGGGEVTIAQGVGGRDPGPGAGTWDAMKGMARFSIPTVLAITRGSLMLWKASLWSMGLCGSCPMFSSLHIDGWSRPPRLLSLEEQYWSLNMEKGAQGPGPMPTSR